MIRFVLVLCLLRYSSSQLSANRLVNKPPLILREPPKEVPFRVNHAMEMPCVASGFPPPSYRWLMDGKDYDPSGNAGRVAVQPDVGTLIFSDPLERDEGFYECIAENIMGSAITIKSYIRVAYLRPFPDSSTITHRPKLGDSLTLRCVSPESYPKPVLYWALQSGDRLRQIITNDRITVDFTGSIHFANIIESDYRSGDQYTCMARNEITRDIQQGAFARIIPQGQTAQFNAPEVVYQRSSDETAVVGEKFTIMCIFSGNPTPVVLWSRIGVENEALPDNAEADNYGQSLKFMGVRLNNAGIYQCTGQNEIGYTPLQRSVSLKVEAAPAWVDGWKPISQEVSENETAVFNCKGEGIPNPDTNWFINGKRISTTDKDDTRLVTDNMLTFFNIRRTDSKVIQCNVTNKHGYIFTNAYLNVMEEAPVVEDPPQIDLKVAEGQITNLTCRFYGAPRPQVVWKKGSGEQLTGGRYRIFSDGNLQIDDISVVDAGQYTCIVTNRIDSVSATGNIIVRRRTLIMTRPQDVMVEMGTEAKFTCTGTTDPAEIRNLRIDWKQDGEYIDYDRAQRIFKNVVDNSLTISGTNSLDTGKYTCVATNGIDQQEAGALLIVQEPPDEPDITEVRCEPVKDEDNPEISRIRAEVSWQPGRDHYAPILYYKLQFNTTFSQDTWYDILPPVPERDPNSTVPIQEPLPGILPNATRFEYLLSPYGNYTFRALARNKVGFSDPSQHSSVVCRTEADVPYKNPENVIAEGDKPDNLVIFWTPMAPIEHNGPDFKYVVSWRPADGSKAAQTQTIGRPDAWHYVVDNDQAMETYKKYFVKVTAKNSKGESKANAPWVEGYTGEGSPEVSPFDLMVEEESIRATEAILVWTQVDTSPDSVKGFFKGYRIQFARASEWPENIREEDVILNQGRTLYPRPRNKREIISLNVTIHFRVRGLPPNTLVRLQIRVLNKYYVGPPSQALEFRTPEGEPGPPAKFDILARGPTYFELEWDPPKEINGVLTGYHISFQIVSGLNLGGIQHREPIEAFQDLEEGERAGVRLTGLKPDTYYRVFLRASTIAGQGESIFLDMNTLPAGIPSAPTFGITQYTNESFTVVWEASRGSNPGSVFLVEYRPRGKYEWVRTEQIYLSNTITIWPVDAGTIYQVRVVATNGMGDEAASEWLEVQTKGIAPGHFKLATSFWFYAIFFTLLLVVLLIILFVFAKQYGDKWYMDKEDAIEAEMRQIKAEAVAAQLGMIDQSSREYLYSQSSYPGELKPALEDRSYEVADEQSQFYPPQGAYRDQPSEGYDEQYAPADPVPSYEEYAMQSTTQQYTPQEPVRDEYAVVQKPRRGKIQLERSEGEKGSKDTFV